VVDDRENFKGRPGIARAALFGLCPECGASTLFAGTAKFSDRCEQCGLDFGKFNVGDGPAALLTMVIGALVIVLAIILDAAFRPPFWVHILIWIPFTVGSTTLSLRMAKAALLTLEHRNQAGEAGS
jgi:uncharacterized protein (DUF983 family)